MARFPVLTADQVDQAIGRGGLVLLDFWQAACPPCLALEPRVEAFARQHPGRSPVTASTSTPTSTPRPGSA